MAGFRLESRALGGVGQQLWPPPWALPPGCGLAWGRGSSEPLGLVGGCFPRGGGGAEGAALLILDDVNFDICLCACVSWVCRGCQSCSCDK